MVEGSSRPDRTSAQWLRTNEQVDCPVGGTEGFVLIDEHWGTWNVKDTGLFHRSEEYITCYLPRRLEADAVSNLVTSVLAVSWRAHWILPKTLS